MRVVNLSVFDLLGRASYPLLVDAQTTPFYSIPISIDGHSEVAVYYHYIFFNILF